jgi:hypothetical protein
MPELYAACGDRQWACAGRPHVRPDWPRRVSLLRETELSPWVTRGACCGRSLPDPTEWPDPYDKRPDPRDPEADSEELDFGDVHTPTGATSTSAPNHETDVEVDPRKANPHESDKRG